MQWKKTKDGNYGSKWRDTEFVLYQNPVDTRWHLMANDKHVTQSWPKAWTAMEHIDRQQEALIKAAVSEWRGQHGTANA
jgi:hypothetical protein